MAYNCLNEKNALVMVSWKIFVLWKATGLIYFHAQMQPRKVSSQWHVSSSPRTAWEVPLPALLLNAVNVPQDT